MQVFMLDATTGREVPYTGTVAADKLNGVPAAAPFTCADLQGRYQVCFCSWTCFRCGHVQFIECAEWR
jgi:hypothetical protein